jgi:hypothetical protein
VAPKTQPLGNRRDQKVVITWKVQFYLTAEQVVLLLHIELAPSRRKDMNVLDRAVLYVGVLVAVILAAVGLFTTKNNPGVQTFAAVPPVNITIINNAGTCSHQIAGVAAPNFIPVSSGAIITWAAPDSTQPIEVQFSQAASPFYDFSASRGAASSGQAGPPGNYPYSQVTVNNVPCINAGQLGLIMH